MEPSEGSNVGTSILKEVQGGAERKELILAVAQAKECAVFWIQISPTKVGKKRHLWNLPQLPFLSFKSYYSYEVKIGSHKANEEGRKRKKR